MINFALLISGRIKNTFKLDYLTQHVESLIFIADKPIKKGKIKSTLEEMFEASISDDDLTNAIDSLLEKYKNDDFAFEIVEIGEGFHFMTKPIYEKTIATFLKQEVKKRLSRAAMETLSIIAYKQPVTKREMEQIRGVSCDYSVQKLLEKELINIQGRDDTPGRPLLYGTSEKFMEYFGLKNITDLPKLKDFETPENEIGEKAPIEEERE